MLWFSKKKSGELDLSWIGTDMHSHLLPGIDDGSPDVSTSIELIRGLLDVGYKSFITTPHILWEIYPNTSETIGAALADLRREIENASLNVNIRAGAEYFMDEHFDQLLSDKEPLLALCGNFVLVEFSMVTAKLDLQETLFALQVQNYQPVLAHPERYSYLASRKEVFDDLRASGCLFQLNLLSLTGYYGKTVQQLAEYLVKKDYYDFAGTDLHHSKHLSALQKLNENKHLHLLKDSGKIRNHELSQLT